MGGRHTLNFGERQRTIETKFKLFKVEAMKRQLMDILVCPLCKGELVLGVDDENDQEIVSGSLSCARCNQTYPISDTIPNLLPPELREQR